MRQPDEPFEPPAGVTVPRRVHATLASACEKRLTNPGVMADGRFGTSPGERDEHPAVLADQDT